jgi:hypothetical protein
MHSQECVWQQLKMILADLCGTGLAESRLGLHCQIRLTWQAEDADVRHLAHQEHAYCRAARGWQIALRGGPPWASTGWQEACGMHLCMPAVKGVGHPWWRTSCTVGWEEAGAEQ